MRGHPAPAPTIDELLASRERMNRASTEFLKIDLETALTFVKIARQTCDSVRKARNRLAARKAYDTVAKLVAKVRLNDTDHQIVTDGLRELKKELEALGEQF
jgi:hypothetical protein